jgi:GNAT superfamily N-acetyltransferase
MIVVTFQARFAADFQRLNLEWIQKYFKVEKKDVDQTSNPQALVDAGGEIFFVLRDDRAIATCAIIPVAPGVFEIAKMAVDPEFRGQGLGDVMMEAAINWGRTKGVDKIVIWSNTILVPAINLYKKHGFITVNFLQHPDYERANIEMELWLKSERSAENSTPTPG